jgi:hypothetical protein
MPWPWCSGCMDHLTQLAQLTLFTTDEARPLLPQGSSRCAPRPRAPAPSTPTPTAQNPAVPGSAPPEDPRRCRPPRSGTADRLRPRRCGASAPCFDHLDLETVRSPSRSAASRSWMVTWHAKMSRKKSIEGSRSDTKVTVEVTRTACHVLLTLKAPGVPRAARLGSLTVKVGTDDRSRELVGTGVGRQYPNAVSFATREEDDTAGGWRVSRHRWPVAVRAPRPGTSHAPTPNG